MSDLPKAPGVGNRIGLRAGHLAAFAVYALLAVFAGVALNLGTLTTAIIALLPIAVLIALVFWPRRYSGQGGSFETTGATTQARFSVPLAPGAVKEIVKGNIQGNRRFDLLSEDPTTLVIKARASAFTWGEDIIVTLKDMNDETQIEAECRHKQRTAIIDFGQSRRDLQTVLHGLERAVG